jgi:hypothetical protein
MTQRYVVYEIFTRSRVVVAVSAEDALATVSSEDFPQVALSGRHAVPVDIQPEVADSIWQPGKSPSEQPVGRV